MRFGNPLGKGFFDITCKEIKMMFFLELLTLFKQNTDGIFASKLHHPYRNIFLDRPFSLQLGQQDILFAEIHQPKLHTYHPLDGPNS